jgi:3'-phosphoadenosine 5'-phosphosulfate sulfotransferase (PAPS reductase)/FAD synthetase
VLVERPAWVGQGGGEFVKLNRALLNARAILREAVRYFDPVRVYACFSGGYDSAAAVVMTLSTLWWGKTAWSPHECGPGTFPRPVDLRVLHINTGIGIEATRQYVRDFCDCRDIPYLEVKTPESYEQIVLERGFPGPAMHAKMYQRLKERAIRIAVREAKVGQPRSRTVLLVSGIRHDESMIRAGYQRCVSKVDAQVWINPLYWATIDEFRLIRQIYAVPANPVKDKLGMSGECLCLDGDTPILTIGGWQPIRNIKVGEGVYHLHRDKIGCVCVATIHRNDPAPMVAIKPTYLRPLVATYNHPIYARTYKYGQRSRGRLPRIGDPEFIEAGVLARDWGVNQTISPLSRTLHLIGVPFRRGYQPLGLDEFGLRLLGHFAAEGAYNWRKDTYRDGPGGIIFTLAKASEAHVLDIVRCMEEGLGVHVHRRDWIDERTGRAFITVRDSSRISSDFIQDHFHGRYATEKSFKEIVMGADLCEQATIMTAMWRGDGSEFMRITRPIDVSTYTTSSYYLALQMHELLLRQGNIYGIHATTKVPGTNNPAYQVRREKTKSSNQTRIAFIEDDVLWTPVQKVWAEGVHETFNLTVAGDPNYLTASGLVHNCGAYADKGELLRVRLVCPKTADYIEELERKVWAAGHHWRWEDPGPPKERKAKGDRAAIYQPDEDDFRPMCASCEKTKWVEVGETPEGEADPPDDHGEEANDAGDRAVSGAEGRVC